MSSYVRSGEIFEYEYHGEPSLCDLALTSGVGRCEIFPELCFIEVTEQGEDLLFYLSGENDCIPVDNREHPFEVFKDFFLSLQKYFLNADMGSLLDMLEESNGIDDELTLLRLMTEAETVYLSGQCYYTLKRQEWPRLLAWINTHLTSEKQLDQADLSDDSLVASAFSALADLAEDEEDGTELPLFALTLLEKVTAENIPSIVVHDEDATWETPLLLDGEVVSPTTEIGEFDTPMF